MLSKNDPRFCAKFIKCIGVFQELPFNKFQFENTLYSISNKPSRDYEIGDHILLGKKIPQPNSGWIVYEIAIPEHYWTYEYFEKLSPKEKRIKQYNPRPKTWFNGVILQKGI